MSNEISIKKENDVTLQTVRDLTQLANNAIEAYKETNPIYNKLTKTILDTLSQDDVIDSLDNEELFKLLNITSKNQLVPIQELTKLVTQLNALQDRLDANKEIETLRNIVEELKSSARAKEEAEIVEAALHPEVEDAEFDHLVKSTVSVSLEDLVDIEAHNEPTVSKKVSISDLLKSVSHD